MPRASIRDLRYDFKKIERLLRQGKEVQITNRGRVVARLVPESDETSITKFPDFLKRLRARYGNKVLPVTGSEIIAEDRSHY